MEDDLEFDLKLKSILYEILKYSNDKNISINYLINYESFIVTNENYGIRVPLILYYLSNSRSYTRINNVLIGDNFPIHKISNLDKYNILYCNDSKNPYLFTENKLFSKYLKER